MEQGKKKRTSTNKCSFQGSSVPVGSLNPGPLLSRHLYLSNATHYDVEKHRGAATTEPRVWNMCPHKC
eukprot:2635395-Amphidinium_carterae.2